MYPITHTPSSQSSTPPPSSNFHLLTLILVLDYIRNKHLLIILNLRLRHNLLLPPTTLLLRTLLLTRGLALLARTSRLGLWRRCLAANSLAVSDLLNVVLVPPFQAPEKLLAADDGATGGDGRVLDQYCE